MKKRATLAFVLPLFTSCVGITYEHNAADGIGAAETVSIVRNPEVDEQFVEAITDWFDEKGLDHQVVDRMPADGWALTYKASWSWDITFYLSDVRIAATRDSEEVGHATYNVFAGAFSLDMGKWKEDATVVRKLMERLYSK